MHVQNPICDLPRPGTVQINEDAQVCVHDFDLFATVQLLDAAPAIPLLHKLCGYSYEWKTATPQLTQKWEVNYLYRVFRLSRTLPKE